jgi:enoyl-CoA hydratase/carnithine racemase
MAAPVQTSVEAGVALVRLASPETRNALAKDLREALAAAVERCDADPEVRCIVIAGSEKVFAAGADIKAMAALEAGEPGDPANATLWPRLAAIETPMVAAVAGYALGGGCELALACDMIVADAEARFGQPEITLGVVPGGGAAQRLTRVIGKQRTMEYVLTGRLFDAATAHAWGIVNRLVRKGRWLEEALQLARTVAERPPIAARLAKRAVLDAEVGLAEGLAGERLLFEQAMTTEDRVEGMQAFLEKREPRFRGR